MLSSCDFWTNLRFIMFMNFVMQTFVAPQCSCTCHFNVLMYQKASTKYDPISVIHCIKSLSPSWFALFFSLHVLHIISSSKFKYQTKIAQTQHGVSNWRCLLSSGLVNQALTGILKTLQCDNLICKDEWSKIPTQRCKRLFASYHKCLNAVVAVKGGPISY